MNIKKTSAFRVAAGLLATAGALVLSTGAAHAGDFGRVIYAQPSGKVAGAASFVASADRLVVCDSMADGYSVTIHVYYNDADSKPLYSLKASGKGKCATSARNLAEKHKYYFWAQAGPGGWTRLGGYTA
ncbi:hypothetical protein [Streptomyces sp. NPDC056672]|uniref:hypothetical protein n=1 Tax=Streptomyces sp. NPDC056672 TaxID=3345906 RepID=UPI00369ECA3F